MATANNHYSRLMHLRLPRVCVAIAAANAGELLEKAEGVSRDNHFIELRLDYIARPGLALSKIKEFTGSHPHVSVIATCRRVPSGGKFKGSISSQLEVLQKAAEFGCQLVDVELQTAARLKPAQLARLHSKAALVLSFHDFKSTAKLDETLRKMSPYPADFYKIVSTATCLYDNVTMMQFLEKHQNAHSLIGLCMGEQGIISRVVGVRAGTVFTFGALTSEEKTAPGQVTAQELRSIYRIDQVDAATKVYGVAGDPISHSLSPAIMNAAMRRENVNGVFLPLRTKSLKDLLLCLREIPIHGLSVTMPHKQAILKHLDNTDPQTAKIGACNTVVRSQEGKLYGFNTDSAGVIAPLEQRIPLADARILVLGAGGAARAAVFGLKERGAEVFVLNRNAEKGHKLARQAKARTVKRTNLKKLDFEVIINATPVGMGNTRESPLNADEIRAKYVFDMVYDPAETKLLEIAKERGAEVIPGSVMFVHQAARQFEIFTGKPAPREDMLRIVMLALSERARPATLVAVDSRS
ncbi:MAG TPA: shikimate dehydrogenase [Terriglobales bacterium]|nr:shikimate dehydrogenase [Terriglobales bacterium]